MIVPGSSPSEEQDRAIRIRNLGRVLAWGVIGVFALMLMLRLRNVLILFYFALILGLALNPAIHWLERRRVPRSLAVVALALVILGLVGMGVYWIVPPAISQAEILFDNYPLYVEQGQEWGQRMLTRYPEAQEWLQEQSGAIQESLLRVGVLLRHVGSWVMGLGGALISLVLVFFLLIFGLANPQPMARALFALTPPQYNDRIETSLCRIQEKCVAWLGGTFIVMVIIGVFTYAGLAMLGVPHALLFGILAAMGELVPNLGPILSAVPPILLMLLTDPIRAVGVAIFFVIVQQVESHLLTPLVLGNRLEVHPWGLILMILVMGDLFGVLGVILATPTAAILGVIYDELLPKPGTEDSVPIIRRVERVLGGHTGRDRSDSC